MECVRCGTRPPSSSSWLMHACLRLAIESVNRTSTIDALSLQRVIDHEHARASPSSSPSLLPLWATTPSLAIYILRHSMIASQEKVQHSDALVVIRLLVEQCGYSLYGSSLTHPRTPSIWFDIIDLMNERSQTLSAMLPLFNYL